VHVVAKLSERRSVCFASRTNDQVVRLRARKNHGATELPNSALQLISADGGKSELRDHNREADVSNRSIESLYVEQARTDAPP
jgi:hypothetical protein